jgi:SAM-dependent methyltransferase
MLGLGIVRRARSLRDAIVPLPTIRRRPASPIAWVAEANRRFDSLGETSRERMTAYGLVATSPRLRRYAAGITKGAGEKLRQLSRQPLSPHTIDLAIEEIIKWLTIVDCATAFRKSGYFDAAEGAMQEQWDQIIWPIIAHEDFTHSLDLACGHGRNTEMLRQFARTVDLVDVNEPNIEICRTRFGDRKGDCSFRYHVTDGNGLATVADASISLVYSWDSMVHFEKAVVQSYVTEIARVLKGSGSAFLHTSNYGSLAPNSDWSTNHGGRSDMTAEMVRQFAEHDGLSVKFQRLSGISDGRSVEDLDCLTLLVKK